MSSWKDDNTLKSVREAEKSEVHWRRYAPEKPSITYTYRAEGYPIIEDYYTGFPAVARNPRHKYHVFVPDLGFLYFETLKDAKAFAEVHPIK